MRHAVRNLSLGLLNALALGLLAAPLITQVALRSEEAGFGLLRLFPLPPMVATIGAILLFDGWMYLWHRANHTIPFLWSLHRIHHADREMDVTTAVRFHTGEALISLGLRLLLVVMLGLSLPQILLYDTLLIVVIFLHHSNINFPIWLDQFLRIVITTPALHRVHHSVITSETNSNFGSVFSFWDRIANTFRLRDDMSLIIYGVEISEEIDRR